MNAFWEKHNNNDNYNNNNDNKFQKGKFKKLIPEIPHTSNCQKIGQWHNHCLLLTIHLLIARCKHPSKTTASWDDQINITMLHEHTVEDY